MWIARTVELTEHNWRGESDKIKQTLGTHSDRDGLEGIDKPGPM
jgi:hypothetical protein